MLDFTYSLRGTENASSHMIVGADFIWLHFPKTGGMSTESALRLLRPDAVFDPIDPNNVIWHHGIHARKRYDASFSPAGKRVICGFRRLPHWLLSRVLFEASRPPYRTITREMLVQGQFFEQDGDLNTADKYARAYSRYPVDDWIRIEHAADDLAQALQLPPQAVRSFFTKKNASPSYPKNIGFWFTPNELAGVYAACPDWTRIERKVYGDILTLPEEP